MWPLRLGVRIAFALILFAAIFSGLVILAGPAAFDRAGPVWASLFGGSLGIVCYAIAANLRI